MLRRQSAQCVKKTGCSYAVWVFWTTVSDKIHRTGKGGGNKILTQVVYCWCNCILDSNQMCDCARVTEEQQARRKMGAEWQWCRRSIFPHMRRWYVCWWGTARAAVQLSWIDPSHTRCKVTQRYLSRNHMAVHWGESPLWLITKRPRSAVAAITSYQCSFSSSMEEQMGSGGMPASLEVLLALSSEQGGEVSVETSSFPGLNHHLPWRSPQKQESPNLSGTCCFRSLQDNVVGGEQSQPLSFSPKGWIPSALCKQAFCSGLCCPFLPWECPREASHSCTTEGAPGWRPVAAGIVFTWRFHAL